MSNLSSLSKALLCAGSSVALCAADAVSGLVSVHLSWLTPLGVLMGLGAIGYTLKAQRSLKALSAVVKDVAAGDFEKRIIKLGERGEIQALAQDINFMTDTADAFVRESSASLAKVRQGVYHRKIVETGLAGSYLLAAHNMNLAMDAMREKFESFRNLTNAFEENVMGVAQRVRSASSDLDQAAGVVSVSAHESHQKTCEIDESATRMTGNVTEVAGAVKELSSAVQEIGHQLHLTVNLVRRVADESQSTVTAISELDKSAREIGEVVEFIQDVAEQTNLLALNATIEAARAGTAGKGFAVVASEVKSLANQTAQATGSIAQRVQLVQQKTDSALSAIRAMTKSIQEMESVASAISAAVEEQDSATRDIARNMEEAAVGSQHVGNSLEVVSNAVGETQVAAKQLTQAAAVLDDDAVTLQNALSGYLEKARLVA